LIAVLDGVDVDSGTAAEIGFAYALGMRIFGLRTDFRLAGDNLGSIVNLQVQYFIEQSGGRVVETVDEVAQCAAELNAGFPTKS
jgi:nucleoside 2-deoxyribosyltransferase